MKKLYALVLALLACNISAQPTRNWATYYGGTITDFQGYSNAVDANGNVYIAGQTSSTNSISTLGCHQPTFGGGTYDAFLAKFNSSGVLQWATYYGDAGDDIGYSVALDASGNVYLGGSTTSTTGISTGGSHQSAFGGGTYDAFLVKFNASGVRQWATYYGGAGDETGFSVAINVGNNIHFIGYTNSTSSISTVGSHQVSFGGGSNDAFLVQFNSSGVRQWATYYGGSADDTGTSAAIDGSNNIYFCGGTASAAGISTAGAHQVTFGGGSYDAYLAKFNSSGVRQWGTYYGGTALEEAWSVAVDGSSNVYITGETGSSASISTGGSHQTTFGGGTADAYLVKFNTSGVRQWGTYYGGTGNDYVVSVSTDLAGNIYISGRTASSTGISTVGSYQAVFGGGTFDACLIKFNTSGVRQWGTYYGGTTTDYGQSVIIDANNNIYFSGHTNSSNAISSLGSYQPTLSGGFDVFLVQFCQGPPPVPSSISGITTMCTGAGVTNYSVNPVVAAMSYTWSLPGGWSGSSSTNTIAGTPGSSGIFTVTASNACGTSPQQTLNVTVNPLPTITVNSGSICSGNSFTIVPSGANTYTIQGGSAVVSPTANASYTVIGTSTAGCVSASSATSNVTVNTTPTVSMAGGAICQGGSFTLSGSGANTYTYSSGPVVSPTVTTTYSVTGTSTAGCVSNMAVATVTVTNNLTVTITGSNTVCSGQPINLTAGGASTYTWNTGATTTTIAPTPTANTTYSVTGASGSCSNTAMFSVTVNPLPTINASTNNTLICVGQSATLTASGASTYTWNPGGAGTSIVVSPSVTSTYTITGTSSQGCNNSSVFTQSVSTCAGIKTFEEALDMKVYPNPTDGLVTLTYKLSWLGFEVSNSIGEKINIPRNNGKTWVELDFSNQPKGIYFIKIGTATRKIIKE